MKTSDISPARAQALLERVVTLYEKALPDSGQTLDWLRQRGLNDSDLLSSHRIGWCPGTLDSILPRCGGARRDLKTLGILRGDSTDRLAGCLTFPILSPEGMIRGITGWNPETNREVRLPRLSVGLWNASAVLLHSDLIIAPNVIDALALVSRGYRNTVAVCDPVHAESADLAILTERGPDGIRCLVRKEEDFKQFEPVLKQAAGDRCHLSFQRIPGGRPIATYLLKYGKEKLIGWLESQPDPDAEKAAVPERKKTAEISPPEHPGGADVSLLLGALRYEVLGLERDVKNLKGTVRASSAGRLHVDTLDLYSARSRKALARDLALVFDQPFETVQADLLRLLRACETWRKDNAGKPDSKQAVDSMTAERREAAMALGKRSDLIEAILADYETCGLVGERHNKLLCYLAAVSRKMDTPLSVLVLSSSGAGKSALQSTTLAFCPPEDVVQATTLTGRALFYQDEEALRHRILAVEEGIGMEASDYAVRALISARYLSVEFVTRERGTGKLKTMSRRIPGPTSVFCTVTDPNIDAETRSRFFVVGVDETRKQTQRILELQRQRHTLAGLTWRAGVDAIREKHRDFQRLLRPVVVVNPYAGELVYGDDRLQARRDQPKYLNLIRAVAFLHQMGREIKHENGTEYIDVIPGDIETAHDVFTSIYGTSLDELSVPARNLLRGLTAFVSRKLEETEGWPSGSRPGFTRREIRERMGWSQTRLHVHLKELLDLEYVIRSERTANGLHIYRLLYSGEGLDGSRFQPGIRTPERFRIPEKNQNSARIHPPFRGRSDFADTPQNTAPKEDRP
ncbi:MAG: hypothetical protein RRC34_13780 [Lentisphaeria bacterium]|nr:hypothetical protein [Lentisphaeria bacterium]